MRWYEFNKFLNSCPESVEKNLQLFHILFFSPKKAALFSLQPSILNKLKYIRYYAIGSLVQSFLIASSNAVDWMLWLSLRPNPATVILDPKQADYKWQIWLNTNECVMIL